MKILFVTTAIPFPPRQGVELPNAHIAEALSQAFELDLLVITKNEEEKQQLHERQKNVPKSIHQTLHLHCRDQRSTRAKIFQEIQLKAPSFFLQGYAADDLNQLFLDSPYDAVWFSPVGCLGLLKACQQLGLTIAPQVALGCNDVITTTYFDSLKEWLSGRMGFSRQRLLQGLRTGVILLLEKRYLQQVDLLHVQTPLEKKRAHWVLSNQAKQPQVIAAQNGRKRLLEKVTYQSQCAPAAKRVLYMTHLQGGRAKESVWFLERVWPKVIQTHPDAELLLAGTPPLANSDMARSLPPEAQVLGYVEDLVALYSSATVAVVPIVHSTGLINRALDALMAGVPLVSTPAVLSTIANCEPGRDAIAAYSATDFSQAICTLLANPEQRKTYSIQGRALAQQQPTWQESTNAIVSALREICHLEKSASPASPTSQENSQTIGEKKPKERSIPSLQPHS